MGLQQLKTSQLHLKAYIVRKARILMAFFYQLLCRSFCKDHEARSEHPSRDRCIFILHRHQHRYPCSYWNLCCQHLLRPRCLHHPRTLIFYLCSLVNRLGLRLAPLGFTQDTMNQIWVTDRNIWVWLSLANQFKKLLSFLNYFILLKKQNGFLSGYRNSKL